MTRWTEILRLNNLGISQRDTAKACECSRNSVAKAVRRAAGLGITWPLAECVGDAELGKILFGERKDAVPRKAPDYERVRRELAKDGVTLTLLWSEYAEACRAEGARPLMYTQFCAHYGEYAAVRGATMHIERKPGERMEVDWAGTAMTLESLPGEVPVRAYLFAAVLPHSEFGYAEACLRQDLASWITANVNALEYFGGAPKIIVPDNLKTGVAGHEDWYTPVINKTFRDMAEHYGAAVIPARVRKPKDKPSAEGAVKVMTTWIIAALRNREFLTIGELNAAVRGKLEEYNARPFQKRDGNRKSAFEEEKPFLTPLPPRSFEMAVWKTAKVQMNYHIAAEKMNYSVPSEYIGREVNVRLTKDMVEIFYNDVRVASHVRLYGQPNQYSTLPEHMPDSHREYAYWTGRRFRAWAANIGPSSTAVVSALLASRPVEQQAYKACMGLLRLADKYSVARLERACAKALSYSEAPSLKSVRLILQNGGDKREDGPAPEDSAGGEFAFVRGAEYYGGEN